MASLSLSESGRREATGLGVHRRVAGRPHDASLAAVHARNPEFCPLQHPLHIACALEMSENDHSNSETGPLAGAVICCTSLDPEQKTRVNTIVPQLGARHILDLTSETTHLLVGSLDTPKYRYVAKERKDVKVLQPGFLEAVRQSWMAGGDTDLNALEAEYRLPTFSGLNMCVTGFDNSMFPTVEEIVLGDCLTSSSVQQRMGLVKIFEENGAAYHGDLTRSTVSHLICSAPEGKKYQFAKNWDIKVVTVEWVRDSVARGMVLDESLYDPTLPPEERGIGAVTNKRLPSPGNKRPLSEAGLSKLSNGNKRRLRRTASAKYESQDDGNIWADIASAEAGVKQVVACDWSEAPQIQAERDFHGDSVAPQKMADTNTENNKQSTHSHHDSKDPKVDPRAIFRGYNFLLHHAFDRTRLDTLSSCLESQGANVLVSEDTVREAQQQGQLDHVITISAENIPAEEIVRLRKEGIVTEKCPIKTFFWIEHCLYAKLVVSTNTPLCDPFPTFPIDGFNALTICPTSFKGVELLHFSKAVKLMGAKYEESCSPTTSLIVGNKGIPNVDKLKYALNHGIPVVDAEWFYECTRRGELLPIEPYFPPSYAIEYERKMKDVPKHEMSRKLHGPHSPGRLSAQAEKAHFKAPEQTPINGEAHAETEGNRPLSEIGQKINSPPKRDPPAQKRLGRGLENHPQSSPTPQLQQMHDETPQSASNPIEADTNASALNAALRTLLAQRKAAPNSRPTSQEPPPRRHRKLGRATSNPSSHGGTSFIRSHADSFHQSQEDFPEGQRSAQREESQTINPSQTLTYEDPESIAARKKVLEKMGQEFIDEDEGISGVRVQSIGVVEDFTAGGLGERAARRKTRRK